MSTLPDTVIEYSRFAAQEFLQTVVFVDDQIKERPVVEPRNVTPPKQRKAATKKTTQKNPQQSESDIIEGAEEIDDYSPYDVVTSFAKKQIICSLYEPKRDEIVSKNSEIFPLCLAADVVIVDWNLYGDHGEKILELIDGLVQQAVRDVPEQLRLILIYTQELDLSSIADRLSRKVSASIGDEFKPLPEDGLAFQKDNSRISIIGKAGQVRPDEYTGHIVAEGEMADFTVKEFSKLACGLLHAVTLLGLAEIKKNSRKVLSKFNERLDPAFLTHMAMCRPEADASTHIVPLIVSEIESILEDVLPNPPISHQLIRDWCQNIWEPGEHLNDLLGSKDLDVRAIAETICLKGFKEAKKDFNQIHILTNKNKDKIRKSAKILLSKDDSDANHKFSHLMASRTFYRDMVKALTLGSVIYDEKNDNYLLCVQPVCDSVRLNGERTFLFVELTETAPESEDQTSHIVLKEDGKAIELFYNAKSYQCYVVEFSPDQNSKQVLSITSNDGTPAFFNTSKERYIWIDQLKTSHAQRAVEKLASDLSRVGLTESGWLRLLEKK